VGDLERDVAIEGGIEGAIDDTTGASAETLFDEETANLFRQGDGSGPRPGDRGDCRYIA
jgi:hypothetical protein